MMKNKKHLESLEQHRNLVVYTCLIPCNYHFPNDLNKNFTQYSKYIKLNYIKNEASDLKTKFMVNFLNFRLAMTNRAMKDASCLTLLWCSHLFDTL